MMMKRLMHRSYLPMHCTSKVIGTNSLMHHTQKEYAFPAEREVSQGSAVHDQLRGAVCDGFKVLKLPYRSGKDTRRYSMCWFLPNAKDGLPALVERLSSESGFLDDHIPYSKVSRREMGEFRNPKFKFAFEFEASGVLEELGLLGGSTEEVKSLVSEPLFFPSIYQKAGIEVDENGTEAAAVTYGQLCGGSLTPPKKIDFVADHPFMFVIREEVTKTVLFIGYVLNPLEG